MSKIVIRASILTALLGATLAISARAVVYTPFTDPHPVMSGGTIGFAYAGDKFVGSVQGDGMGQLYSTDLNGGSVQVFAPGVSLAPSLSSEHFVAASVGAGGFAPRDLFVAAGNSVVHITHDGLSSSILTSGLTGDVRGILFDTIGTFGGDMLVTTHAGAVYRVNSAGVATPLASTGEDTEGLDIAPIGAGFGAYDGQLVVASEGSGLLRAISTAGVVSVLNPNSPIGGVEELSFVPLTLGLSGNPVEGMYGANYTPNVVKAGAGQFAGMQGDIIVTSETGHGVYRVHWNGTTFENSLVGSFPNQPEDGIFVTAAHINGGVPEPSSLALLAAGLLPLLGLRRKK
ncbi:MAG TPA: PEP-CTERM sorting domain-containing protein [Armatimonadota bacterium]|jgi:hypothetical protein